MSREIFDKPRREIARLSIFGTTQLHLRNPYIIAWWSIIIPGFGHLLLSKYLRGYLLVLLELLINTSAKINQAMVYSFTGEFEMAKEVMDLRWMALYAPVYLFSVYDSYRTTVDLNKVYLLAKREDKPIQSFTISPVEINYLDKRIPWVSVIWSIMLPGAGQLYIHRILTATYLLLTWILIVYQSNAAEALHLTLLGDFQSVNKVLNAQWLLFLPSLYLFAIYDAYTNVVENNKLFEIEQRQFLIKHYQLDEAKKILHEVRVSGK